MRWNLNWIIKHKNDFVFDEKIAYEKDTFKNISNLNDVRDIEIKGKGHYNESTNQLYVDYSLRGVMVLPCAISLEDVDYPFEISNKVIFAFYKPNEDEDVVEAKRDTADLNPIIFQDIILEIPAKIVKEGAVLKQSGNGWRVINEDDIAEKDDEIDPRFAQLKDYFKDREG